MKKAAIYLRVSTNDQDYQRQEVELRQLAKALGYEIIDVYEEKASAVHDMETRVELTKMRKLKKEDVERIFIWDISRLSRKATNFIALVTEFAEKGICLHFKDKDIKTLDDDGKINAFASIYLYMLGVFAQMDAENLKAKFKSGKENALRKGHSYTNIAPFGYYLKDKHLYINESESEFVKLAFNLYSEGKDLQYVADIFNARKVPLKSGKTDIIWVKGTIYQLLKNTVYFGKGKLENINNKVTKESTIRYFDAPVIIDKGLFDNVQERFSLNKSQSDKGRTEISLLRGLLFCGLCGKPYIFANNNKHRIYRDSDMRANVNQRIGCQNGQLNIAKGDDAVWTSIKAIYHYDQFIIKTIEEKELSKKQYEENSNNIIQINSQIEDIERQQKRLNDGYLKGLFDDNELFENKSRIDSEKNRHNKLINELLAHNSSLQRKMEAEYNPKTFEINNPTLDEKKIICNNLIDSILIFTHSPLLKFLQVKLKNGMVYFIGFQSKKDYIIVFNESNDVKFDTKTKKGTIKGLIYDKENPFSFNSSTSEYDIKTFIESMDTTENRMQLSL
jgi:DNA invertase Pin-like site-specific DNA recombinase